MVVVEFPGNFRDLTAMKNDKLEFSSSSDVAVKMYDAMVHQMVYHYESPLLGGNEGTYKVDPNYN